MVHTNSAALRVYLRLGVFSVMRDVGSSGSKWEFPLLYGNLCTVVSHVAWAVHISIIESRPITTGSQMVLEVKWMEKINIKSQR